MSGDNGRLPELPRGWLWVSLGDIAGIKLGKMLSRKAFEPHLRQAPYLRNENVRWFRIDTSDVKSMGFSDIEAERFRLEVGDLVVCEGGEPGRCAVVTEDTSRFLFQKALHRVRPIAGVINTRLLQYYFRHCITTDAVLERRSETTIKHLPLEKMRRVPVALPPGSEQDRILAEIEKQFSRLDAGVAALRRVEANLKRYKAAVLKAACTGALTADWRAAHPDVEPASKLLDRILKERRRRWEEAELAKLIAKGKPPGDDRWKTKYTEPPAPRTTDLPELPESWCWVTAEQLTPFDRPAAYGVLQPGPDLPTGVELVRVCDIQDGAIIRDQLKRIAPEIAGRYPRTTLRGGEVLVTLVGTIGRSAVVPDDLVGANTARAVGVISIADGLIARFVELCFRNPTKNHELAGKAHEVARKTLNLEDVRATCIPLPPVSEQVEIVDTVEDLMSIVQAAETAVNQNLNRAGRLRQSVLKDAFEGKLVAQDPTDEPAHLMIERVRQLRHEPSHETVHSNRRRRG